MYFFPCGFARNVFAWCLLKTSIRIYKENMLENKIKLKKNYFPNELINVKRVQTCI